MIDFGTAYMLAMLAMLGIGFFAALSVPLTSELEVAETSISSNQDAVDRDDSERKARMSKACAQRRQARKRTRGYA